MSNTTQLKRPISGLYGNRQIKWRGAVSVVSFFVLWHLAVVLELSGFAELPTPIAALTTFFGEYMADPEYWGSWVVSFQRVFYGFIIAQILGIPLGLLFGTSPRFRDLFFPGFRTAATYTAAGLGCQYQYFSGQRMKAASSSLPSSALSLSLSLMFTMVSVVIKNEHIWLARSLGASRLSIFRRIMLPSVIPSIAVGMTLGIAITWNVVIAAEMIASDSGLGRMTWEGYVSSTPEVVLIGDD